MEILEKILGSVARVKIMKLFLFNKDKTFTRKDIIKRSRVSAKHIGRELKMLAGVHFVKKRKLEWFFDPSFKYTKEFEALLMGSDNLNKTKLLNNFKKTGKVKLILVSGIFLKNHDSRLDLLIVGDKIRRGRVEDKIRKLEAEIGTELVYAIFDTKEFIYRLNMYDKLIRDILYYPHEIVLQEKGILELSTSPLKKP